MEVSRGQCSRLRWTVNNLPQYPYDWQHRADDVLRSRNCSSVWSDVLGGGLASRANSWVVWNDNSIGAFSLLAQNVNGIGNVE